MKGSPELVGRFNATLTLFIKSFGVSAFIGVSYIAILALVQFVFDYQSGLTHSLVAFVFYVLGIFANYAMQKKVVFRADNSPIVAFFAYNIANALFVSGLSGFLFSNNTMQALFGAYNAGASTAIALLIISPITFIVFKKIFNSSTAA